MVKKDYNTIENIENVYLDNKATLSFEPGRINQVDIKQVGEASQRILYMIKAIQEDGFLGWRAVSDEEGDFSCSVFTSEGLKVSKDDYDWIFKECASTDTGSIPDLRDRFERGRKLYALVYDPEKAKEDSETIEYYDDYDCFENGLKWTASSDKLNEFIEMIAEVGAEIWAIALTSKDINSHGLLFISLPNDIPLRMRGMISLTFAGLKVCDVQSLAKDKIMEHCLPDAHFKELISDLLLVLIRRSSDRIREDDNRGDESLREIFDNCTKDNSKPGDKVADYTPIKKLDLAPCALSCLEREGIWSIEELRSLGENNIRHIRNLGRKNFEEIKEKLSAYLNEHPDIIKIPELNSTSYYTMLNELIGLKEVKDQIKKIAAYSKMQQDMAACGLNKIPVVLNMEFTGNPGTAKTTVARIVAGIFHELGLLSENEMIEAGRADLVGKYEGQTAIKIKEVFEKAKGKVLFIDEAYSLVENWEGAYGDEAISTIVQEMENNRKNTIVIFAGYPDKMKDFFSRNPGLRSRVPFSINFKDYSSEEMVEIVELEAKRRGFSVSLEAIEKVTSMCRVAEGNPEAGNGRFCRNLVEEAILEYALRNYDGTNQPASIDFLLKAEDFSIPYNIKKVHKTQQIGFVV